MRLLTYAALPILVVGLLLGGRAAMRYKLQRERAHWKTTALQQLAGMSLTSEPITTELEQIRHPTPNLDFGWAHEHVVAMTNGEYLVYAFWHGANSGFVEHLFLAHGTDGKWYYSTYHFCNRMAAISADDPPGSIGEFANRYWLREFDGKSDECLRSTEPLK